MENESLNPMDCALDYEELLNALDEVSEEICEDADAATEDAETKRAKILRKCAQLKNRCVDGAKTYYGATKARCAEVKGHCVEKAKSGYGAAKVYCGTAKTRCVDKAKSIAAKAKAYDYNPHFKQTRTYKLEMLPAAKDAEPVDTFEISDEKEFSARSLAIAGGVVIAVTAVTGILIGTLLDD